MAYQAMKSRLQNENSKPWLNENFGERFRQALGREMTDQEREFFGLQSTESGTEEAEGAD